jgi:hypothetical protein
MDGNELRPLQAPLKKRYREQPETERTPARAEAVLKSFVTLTGDRGFESCSLQRRVCEPPVPLQG